VQQDVQQQRAKERCSGKECRCTVASLTHQSVSCSSELQFGAAENSDFRHHSAFRVWPISGFVAAKTTATQRQTKSPQNYWHPSGETRKSFWILSQAPTCAFSVPHVGQER